MMAFYAVVCIRPSLLCTVEPLASYSLLILILVHNQIFLLYPSHHIFPLPNTIFVLLLALFYPFAINVFCALRFQSHLEIQIRLNSSYENRLRSASHLSIATSKLVKYKSFIVRLFYSF
eukprot:NODE_727_length_4761_cov_0.252038.p4 type:complete len:119 gc:universal NODE_727_length_4761_cov_0.252038:3404-3048(-)